MKLKIIGIESAGEIERERIVVQATVASDIGRFAIFASNASSENKPLSGNVPFAYWFPFKNVKDGDFIVVYSKTGSRSEKTNESGRTSYFYYWGMTNSIWNKSVIPVLVETTTWEMLPKTQ